MSYVLVPTAAIVTALVKAGFVPKFVGTETIYERANHRCPELIVRVYTSVSAGAATARACGTDAIRACLVWIDPKKGDNYGVASATRVHRTGLVVDVIARMMARTREMYALANHMAGNARCTCRAPRYLDSGKCIRHHEHEAKALASTKPLAACGN